MFQFPLYAYTSNKATHKCKLIKHSCYYLNRIIILSGFLFTNDIMISEQKI